jgi:hypothetical protein
MKNTHAAVESAKLICSDRHWVDFHQAVNYLSGRLAWIFPKSYKASTNNNNNSQITRFRLVPERLLICLLSRSLHYQSRAKGSWIPRQDIQQGA